MGGWRGVVRSNAKTAKTIKEKTSDRAEALVFREERKFLPFVIFY
jgi:hypothetical protein